MARRSALRPRGTAGAADRVDAAAAGQPDPVLRGACAARCVAVGLVPATADSADPAAAASSTPPEGTAGGAGGPVVSRPGGMLWAELMRRTFGIDVLACPRCGGRLRLVALIDQAPVIHRILRHLGLPTDVPEPQPARAPPWPLERIATQFHDVPNSTPPGEHRASCGEGCRLRAQPHVPAAPRRPFPLAVRLPTGSQSAPTPASSALSKGGGRLSGPRTGLPLTATRP